MKKIILIPLCFFIFLQLTSAQVISKHDQLFGGSFSFSVFNMNSIGTSNYNSGNIGFFPSYGWAIKNDLIFGIRGSVDYLHVAQINSASEKTIANSLTFGPGIF